MSIEEAVVEKLRGLPEEKQRKVLDFVRSLESSRRADRPGKSLKGLWSEMGFTVRDEDIAEIRREMWGKFPRDDI